MKKRATVFFLAAAAVFVILILALGGGKDEDRQTGGNPGAERALRAAAIAGELASVARSQLDSLSGDAGKDVETVVRELEDGAERVRKLLEESAPPESLDAAAETLEKLLSEIITDYRPEPPQQREGSASP
ncbi:hypothetical protein [Aminivibrio sp.]|jgi:ABC-type Na+ efflux pump permease subunit|uniref:hypothetical protein n=1 Tax=Aminivibrio sp. TaxID=1872489 RepID=UPI001A556040|nr:hypothetical protein [Aminivibrio sp.]MBL3539923.1 hypothetical protein [Aminivibrio sp.]MDK2959474.1 hypothetical protein [Synergistaceae bacterium]